MIIFIIFNTNIIVSLRSKSTYLKKLEIWNGKSWKVNYWNIINLSEMLKFKINDE